MHNFNFSEYYRYREGGTVNTLGSQLASCHGEVIDLNQSNSSVVLSASRITFCNLVIGYDKTNNKASLYHVNASQYAPWAGNERPNVMMLGKNATYTAVGSSSFVQNEEPQIKRFLPIPEVESGFNLYFYPKYDGTILIEEMSTGQLIHVARIDNDGSSESRQPNKLNNLLTMATIANNFIHHFSELNEKELGLRSRLKQDQASLIDKEESLLQLKEARDKGELPYGMDSMEELEAKIAKKTESICSLKTHITKDTLALDRFGGHCTASIEFEVAHRISSLVDLKDIDGSYDEIAELLQSVLDEDHLPEKGELRKMIIETMNEHFFTAKPLSTDDNASLEKCISSLCELSSKTSIQPDM